MPNGQGGRPGGLNGVFQQNAAPPHSSPPAGSPPLPLPSSDPVTTTGQPPDYKALGTAQAKADFAAAANSGTWEFDPNAIKNVIQKLEGCLDDEFDRARRAFRKVKAIASPGAEYVSTRYVDAAKRASGEYETFLIGAVNYISSYIDTLRQIQTAYVNQDHAAMDAFRESGKVV